MSEERSADRPEQKSYWFEAKSFGIGWTLPVTWQGWVVVVVFLVLLIGACFVSTSKGSESRTSSHWWWRL